MAGDWVEYSGIFPPVPTGVYVEVAYKNGLIEVVSAEDATWDEAEKYRILQSFTKPEGRKDDKGKDRFSLVPLDALQAVIRVLEFGANKYGVDNWKKVEGSENRYYDAIFRHLFAYRRGEAADDESGLSHLAHAACCVLFLLDEELNYED